MQVIPFDDFDPYLKNLNFFDQNFEMVFICILNNRDLIVDIFIKELLKLGKS